MANYAFIHDRNVYDAALTETPAPIGFSLRVNDGKVVNPFSVDGLKNNNRNPYPNYTHGKPINPNSWFINSFASGTPLRYEEQKHQVKSSILGPLFWMFRSKPECCETSPISTSTGCLCLREDKNQGFIKYFTQMRYGNSGSGTSDSI